MISEIDPLVYRSTSVTGEKETRRSRIFEETGRMDGTKSQIIIEEVEERGFKKSSVSLVEQTMLSVRIEKSSSNIHALTNQHSTANKLQNNIEWKPTQTSKVKNCNTASLITLLLVMAGIGLGIGLGVWVFKSGSTQGNETISHNLLGNQEGDLLITTVKGKGRARFQHWFE